jgi:hypothetical protein
MAHAGELPEGWSTQVSRSTGDVFYVNTVTNESTYDMPTVTGAEGAAGRHGEDEFEADFEQHAEELPEGWTTHGGQAVWCGGLCVLCAWRRTIIAAPISCAVGESAVSQPLAHRQGQSQGF